MEEFFQLVVNSIPNFVFAILWLIVAFVVAFIAKSLTTKLLKALKAEQYLSKLGVLDTTTNTAIGFVAKLVYFIVFFLFLPSALNKLGLNMVSDPITRVVNTFLAVLPNLVAAVVIIVVGLFIAKLVKDLLIPILKALKIDALQEKAGIQPSESTSFSVVLGNIVYAIIVLMVVTAGLNQLGISAISGPANQIVTAIFNAIPNVLCAIALIALGVFIAVLVEKALASILGSIGTDKLTEKITGSASKLSLSKAIAAIVKWVIIVIFVVQGINVLQLAVLTKIGSDIIAYMPAVLSAVIVVAIAIFAANTVETRVLKKFPNAKAGALACRIAIYVLAAVLCLSQLNIAAHIAESTFLLIVAALCVAFAIAFGVGGRSFAQNVLSRLEDKISNDQDKTE